MEMRDGSPSLGISEAGPGLTGARGRKLRRIRKLPEYLHRAAGPLWGELTRDRAGNERSDRGETPTARAQRRTSLN